ncbi:linear amide C-N hydrolase [Vibrio tubiashii]|uniref:linear amide C-N hydrolase n=1 Tax=Vibrio tubiashii TaxID=29498 RepID=UPI001EFE0146|nr:linear amide C-N hydrolase [Vibrio tubiashii]MCG9581907.1 linear amide C-N hydrolase [Vibrio tubiashii]MCG9615498.1 linear amide C-N hydrolase [Vibrio tubiashii]MCG9688594.1 linear amide C-N hydrolase [Vibrio tubiashii]
MNFKKTILAATLAAASTVAVIGTATACTTAAYHNGDASMTVRTMDWFGHDDARIVGTGEGVITAYSVSDNAVETKSKYATLKIKSFKPQIVAEAMNSEGLEARILYLGKDYTEFPVGDNATPDVDASMVPQWAVDNFQNVEEVVEALNQVDVIDSKVCDLPNHEGECISAPVHYQFVDKSGKTAVVEFVKGEMKVYQGEGSHAMSNDPEFSIHLELDKANNHETNGGIHPIDRRARAMEVLDDMYSRNVTDSANAMNSIKAVGATVFAGYDRLDHTMGDNADVFPTLWTVYTDRNQGQWVFDRYDTWEIEKYNFSMFDNNSPISVELGAHPITK